MWIFDKNRPDSNPYQTLPFYQITQCSYVPKPLPWTPYPHFHDDEYEVLFIAEGAFLVNLPGCVVPVKAGDVIFIPPSIAHCIKDNIESVCVHYAVRFRRYASDNCRQKESQAEKNVFLVRDCRKILMFRQILDMIQKIGQENEGTIDGRIQALTFSLLEIVGQEFHSNGDMIETSAPEYANDIMKYLQNHIHEKITMEDLVRQFNFSASHISRVFSRAYHTSPIRYLIYSRMRTARLYLLKGDLTVPEIGRRLAYHNIYHFSRAFEEFFHCLPEQYREGQFKNEM